MSAFAAEMKSALSSALIYNQAAVLKAVIDNKSLILWEICTAQEDAKDNARKTSFQERASHTLSSIRNNDMISKRDNCLAELKKLS